MKVIESTRKEYRKLLFVIASLSFSLYFLLPSLTFSATLSHKVEENKAKKEIKVTFLLDALGETLNAFEGSLIYDTKKLVIDSIETDNSLVTNWITAPERDNSPLGDNDILFEGLTPGGFAGVLQNGENKREAGELFSVIFSVKEEGEASIALSGIRVYKNDGEGSEVETLDYRSTLPLSKEYLKASYFVPLLSGKEEEGDSADYVFAEIMSMSEIYDGKPFLIFENKNKQKSLVNFLVSETVSESPNGLLDFSWTEAKSPHLLAGGNLSRYVHVKVIYSDGSYKTRTIATVEKGEESKQIYYILMVALSTCLFFLMASLYVFNRNKEKE